MTLIFRYVPHRLFEAYKAAGWELDNDMRGTHHGHYAVMMRWCGEGEPVEPEATVEQD